MTCPWHQWRYSLLSGECVASPGDEGRATRIELLDVRVGKRGTFELAPQREPDLE